MIVFDLVWWNLNLFCWASCISTQYTVSWCLLHFSLLPCKKWCIQVNVIRIFVFFVHRIHRRKEYSLSFAQIFVLPVSILNLWWSVNWLHIRCGKCTRRNCWELTHCLVVKDQWDCVLNDLEELGDKEFLVLMDQYNIEIFSCFLRPFCHSTLPLLIRPMSRNLKFVPKIIF